MCTDFRCWPMFSDFRSSSQVVEPWFGVQKNVGRSFCERELGQFCASPLFSDEKQSESFFWKRTERERNGGKRKSLIFIHFFFFDGIFYFLFFFGLRGTYTDNAIHTRGEIITSNSYNSNITNPNQVRIN